MAKANHNYITQAEVLAGWTCVICVNQRFLHNKTLQQKAGRATFPSPLGSEERNGRHIEALLADVLPLKALELLDGFDDLGRVLVEPVLKTAHCGARWHLAETAAEDKMNAHMCNYSRTHNGQ